MASWLAIDIGGANIKLADGKGYAETSVFHLWRHSNELAQELRKLIAEAPRSDHLAVTMTGELADCFETKSAGVKAILNEVIEAADNRHTRVYTIDGKLVTPQVGIRNPLSVAAANWHALARFLGRFFREGTTLVVDIGSTTCDIIPLVDGEVAATAISDTDRLLAGELVYTGVDRTPLCAIANSAPYRGQPCPVAREFFASARDVYTILKNLPEDTTLTSTADGQPATKAAARTRLSRMICANDDQFNHRDAVSMAQGFADAQIESIILAVQNVLSGLSSEPAQVICSGLGEFLGESVFSKLEMKTRVTRLSDKVGGPVSRCAPAHALAILARDA